MPPAGSGFRSGAFFFTPSRYTRRVWAGASRSAGISKPNPFLAAGRSGPTRWRGTMRDLFLEIFERGIREDGLSSNRILEELEIFLIQAALEAKKKNQTQAAAMLRLGRGTLAWKIKKYAIEVPQRRKVLHAPHPEEILHKPAVEPKDR